VSHFPPTQSYFPLLWNNADNTKIDLCSYLVALIFITNNLYRYLNSPSLLDSLSPSLKLFHVSLLRDTYFSGGSFSSTLCSLKPQCPLTWAELDYGQPFRRQCHNMHEKIVDGNTTCVTTWLQSSTVTVLYVLSPNLCIDVSEVSTIKYRKQEENIKFGPKQSKPFDKYVVHRSHTHIKVIIPYGRLIEPWSLCCVVLHFKYCVEAEHYT